MRITINGIEKLVGCETHSIGHGNDDFGIKVKNAWIRTDTNDEDYNFLIHRFGTLRATGVSPSEKYRVVLERRGPYLTVMNMNATQSSPRSLLNETHYKDRNKFLSTIFKLIQLVK